jgi:hypothetical protein
VNVSGTGPNGPPLQPLNIGPTLRMALLVKAKDAQKAEGEAALKLIESSAAPAPRDDGVSGTLVDRYA